MIENYLHTSKRLKAVFLLIDIRHEPSENDRMMYEWMLHQGFAPIIIATKSDKLKRTQIASHVQMIREVLHVQEDTVVIPFSAETKEGREEIWNLIGELAELPKPEKAAGKEEIRKVNGESGKKPRWKASGHPVAKKTLKKRAAKKKAKK